MLAPGIEEHPDHRVATEYMKERVEIFMEGEKIVETKNALLVKETGLDPVIYVPRADIQDVHFHRYDDYHCPFKGHAELYDVKHGSSYFEQAAWSYINPYDDMKEIKDYIAFSPNKVQHIRVTG